MYKTRYYSLLLVGLLASCSTGSRSDFKKIPQTDFLPVPLQYVGQPFDGEWRNMSHAAILGELYIKIKPVVVANPLAKQEPKVLQYAHSLTQRFTEKLLMEFGKYKGKGIILADKAPKGKQLLTFEVALISLHATDATINAAGTVAGTVASAFVPFSGTAVKMATGVLEKGHIAVAIRVYCDKELVAEFGEYDGPPTTVLGSLNDFSLWGHQKQIIDEWAIALAADVANYAAGKRVTGYKNIKFAEGLTQ